VARLDGHDERQPGLCELAAEAVLVPIGAVGSHRAEYEASSPGFDREIRSDLQPGAEPGSFFPFAKCLTGVYGTACTG
jgi:hypothetical protein